MSDFPRSNAVVPSHIHSWSRWMNGPAMHAVASIAVPTSQTWTANTAVYIPMDIPWSYHAARAYFQHGSVLSGNSDIGIYTSGGALLWSSGSTANAGSATLPQFVTISPDLMLEPGRYYMAYVNDGTTNQYMGAATVANTGRLCGLFQQATAFPLPATATRAAYAGVGYPLIGITNTASGF